MEVFHSSFLIVIQKQDNTQAVHCQHNYIRAYLVHVKFKLAMTHLLWLATSSKLKYFCQFYSEL